MDSIFKNMGKLLAGLMLPYSLIIGCKSSTSDSGEYAQQMQSLPVITVTTREVTTYQEFSASLEGKKDIEIRPQVEGYIEKIYVDEGIYIKKGRPLFRINDRIYRAQVNNARATLSAAKANLAHAQINVSKLTPLVQNNVVSDIQLKTAEAAYDVAAANVAQAQAVVRNAEINLGYTLITSPVDGYIGRIPLKTGSLVGMTTVEPLTVISETKEIYAYFSLSENDFLRFVNRMPGHSIEEKIKQLPPVELVLADNTLYSSKGKVESISGQFNNSMGAISFRATFPNSEGLLRSGNTGKIRLPRSIPSALVVPQAASFEMQDKVFVFVLADSNKVVSRLITVTGTSGNYYLVEKGINSGEKIVYSGLDRLRDGMVIQPQFMSVDSLLKVHPL